MSTGNRKPFRSRQEAHNYLRALPKFRPCIHPTALFFGKVKKGKRMIIMPYAVVGIEGFGFDPENWNQRWPHVGATILGDGVEIGCGTIIARGTLSDTILEDDVKLDSLVMVAHNVRIGKRTKIAGGAIIGGSANIGSDCFIGLNATIKDHVNIGNAVTVGSGANVVKDVPDGVTVVGNPAKPLRKKWTPS